MNNIQIKEKKGRFNKQNPIIFIRESLFLSLIIGINVIILFLGPNFLDILFLILIDILLISQYIFGYILFRELRQNVDVIGFLFFPFFFTIISVGLYYTLIKLKVIGGTLIIPIIIIFSSFEIIFSLFLLFKNRKNFNHIKKIKTNDIFKASIKKHIYVFVLTIIFFFIFAISPFFIISFNTIINDNECEIKCIVLDLIKNCDNDSQKISSILSWFDKNLSEPNFADMNFRDKHEKSFFHFSFFSYIYEKPPHICFRNDANPHWIINSRCGRCGEHADLFLDMATKAGLNARKINCDGENHAWNEVFITEKNEWIPVDASAVNSARGKDGFVNYDFMEAKVRGDLRKYVNPNATYGNVSYISASYFENGKLKTLDRTKNYTDTINITLNVTNNIGLPIEGVKVKVLSYNRPKFFNEKGVGITNKTNLTGQCNFEIGGGEYHFELIRENFDTYSTNKSSYNESIDQHYLDIELEEEIVKNDFYERIIPIILVGIFIAIIIVIISKISKNFRKK